MKYNSDCYIIFIIKSKMSRKFKALNPFNNMLFKEFEFASD